MMRPRRSRPSARNATAGRGRRRRGFTLIELGIVIAIIGLLVSFILVASYEGLQRANERATQALITKIELGLNERLDALLSQRVDPNGAHQYLATICPPPFTYGAWSAGTPSLPWGLPSDARAHTIAQLDYLKAEVPDVFMLNDLSTTEGQQYPFNFAALPYPASSSARLNYVLPLGHMVSTPTGGYKPESYIRDPMTGNPTGVYNLGPGANFITDIASGLLVNGTTAATSTGIYGASYNARGAFLKILNAAMPTGSSISSQAYDGVDNDGNGWIDELTSSETGMSAGDLAAVLALLANHKHKTARSECLYAFLVGGIGPLGSIFSADDFSPNEIRDTDNDGLPEFVDAWGEPLQFYRWPLHHTSGVQRGAYNPERFDGVDNDGDGTVDNWSEGYTYLGAFDSRQVNQLDSNQQLIAPAWWSNNFNVTTSTGIGPSTPLSASAAAVQAYFLPLVDYNAPYGGATVARQFWDRAGSASPTGARAAFFSKFLVISSGADMQLGVAQLGLDYNSYSLPSGTAPAPTPVNPLNLLLIENTASALSPNRRSSDAPFYRDNSAAGAVDPITLGLSQIWNRDDISNHNIQTAGGGGVR